MTISKNAFALHGWLAYWCGRIAGCRDHAALASVARELDTTMPAWVTQEYLAKARIAYQAHKAALDRHLKG